jgi:glycosyltransferase involved in cell wall biosynthesis
MTTPVLSILIPSYNRAEMLAQTFDSIINQTASLAEVEVLVSDDCSTDHTREVIARYERLLPQAKIFYQANNIGGCENWSFLLARARGTFVFLLSHDDAIAPDFLKTFYELLEEYPQIEMICGDIELRSPDFKFLAHLPLPTPIGLADGVTRCREQLRSHHMVMATIYRRTVLLAGGGWDKQVGSHLDCTAFCRAALRAHYTYYVNRPLLYFRLSPGSWGHQMVNSNQAQLARWYRRKLDLLREDARALGLGWEEFFQTLYRHHVRALLCYLEVELAHGRLNGRQTRVIMRQIMDVFPEGWRDRLTLKLWLATYFGTGWLSLTRKVLRRPDPYVSVLSLFNSFPPPTN